MTLPRVIDIAKVRTVHAAIDWTVIVQDVRKEIRVLDKKLAELEEYGRRLAATVEGLDHAA